MGINKKCRETGKVIFASWIEARLVMLDLKWNYLFKRDRTGRRIKHRQGRPIQRRAYFCTYCRGYHLTKWEKSNFNSYTEKKWRRDKGEENREI
ncbi:hypothetical protein [Sphingobacterium sp. DR205]|uniref:hypothetical protein n=1 Tax=Sphingobacterium sp. DR205 TaxID=2713573 RepID=UPI0013E497E9|nr:hypothetical protein [Sphingobacterium sp. DR205]QIH31450.1 hypothetical protein G6053_00350 [Sphingobacterium sp. DR205]